MDCLATAALAKKDNKTSLRRIPDKVDVFKYKYIHIPWNVGLGTQWRGGHWILVVVKLVQGE